MSSMERIFDDTLIRDNVVGELEWDPQITEPSAIGVTVDNGVATLAGTVSSYADKYAAERAAYRVAGVRSVANDLQVKLTGESTRSDAAISEAAQSALEWDITVPVERIKVTVRDGFVTLDGNVDWDYQRKEAEGDVRHLRGVKGVNNVISVTPRTSPAEAKAKAEKNLKGIQESLKRRPNIEPSKVHVQELDGRIVLTGTVRSWSEREEVERVAWSVPGVTTVENRVTVTPQ